MKETKNLLINQSIAREAVEQENPLKSWNTFVWIFILKNCLKKSSFYIGGEYSCAVSISSWWRTY